MQRLKVLQALLMSKANTILRRHFEAKDYGRSLGVENVSNQWRRRKKVGKWGRTITESKKLLVPLTHAKQLV